jgi:hypothetical protein
MSSKRVGIVLKNKIPLVFPLFQRGILSKLACYANADVW